MPPDTRILIMFANYSNPSSSFVIIKVSIHTGIIPYFIPPNNNHVFEPTVAQYGVNTPRLDRLGSNEFIAWILPTSKRCFLKKYANYGGSLGKNDFSDGGHYRRMKMMFNF